MLMSEAKEIVIFCSNVAKLSGTRALNGFILNVLSYKLLDRKMDRSLQQLLRNYETMISEILCNYDEPSEINLIEIEKSSINKKNAGYCINNLHLSFLI